MGSLLSYRNWVDDPTTTLAFGTGDYEAVDEYPLDNLRTRQLSDTARWTYTGGTGIVLLDVTFATPKRIDVVALLGCNFRQANHVANMSVNLRIGGDWHEPYASIANNDQGVRELPYNLIAVMPRMPNGSAPVADRVILLAEWDALGADHSEAARLWIGDGLYLDGFDGGWAQDFVESGNVDESAGKQAYEDPKPRVRSLDLPLTSIDTAIAWGFDEADTEALDVPSVNGLQHAVGRTGSVLVVPRIETPVWVRRTGVYGRLTGGGRIVHNSGPNWSTSFAVVEER